MLIKLISPKVIRFNLFFTMTCMNTACLLVRIQPRFASFLATWRILPSAKSAAPAVSTRTYTTTSSPGNFLRPHLPVLAPFRTSRWFTGSDDSGFNPKSRKRIEKWHKKDDATDDEQLVYYGPWADSVRWMQGGFQSMAAVSASVIAAHYTGVAPLMEIEEFAAKSISINDSLGFCFGIIAFAAIARAVISTIVVRVYRDELERDYRVIKIGFFPWNSSSHRLDCGDLKPVKAKALDQMLFRSPEKKFFLLFDHRFRYPEDFNRLVGYAGGLYEGEQEAGSSRPRPFE